VDVTSAPRKVSPGLEGVPETLLWAIDAAERRRLEALPGVEDLRTLPLPRGRGAFHGFVLPLATRLPAVRGALLAVLLARFRST
jgi:hypothetical protein